MPKHKELNINRRNTKPKATPYLREYTPVFDEDAYYKKCDNRETPSFRAYQLAVEHILRKAGRPLCIGDQKKVLGDAFDDRKHMDALEMSKHAFRIPGYIDKWEWTEKEVEQFKADEFVISKRWNGKFLPEF